MPTVRVTVFKNGRPSAGRRVTLEFERLLGGGFSNSQNTDQNGQVFFQVEYGESGTVYVDGSRRGKWGSYHNTDVTVHL
ncbi:MAG: hypothetical protein Q9P14_15955 [candidate division KSB1 bacterium]|nr:hypothetical protein [candidate division KSB1 bacterium]MDQ7064214.1 hypothetical protein [candidate division KSB1 bacterium]